LKKSNERATFELMAIYRADQEAISKEMAEAEEYIALADLYEKSAELIRQLDKNIKGLEDGSK